MTGIDLHAIGEESDALMKAAIQFVSELLLSFCPKEVWAAKRAHKKKVAAEECKRLRPIPLLIEEHKAQVLGSMPRRVKHGETQLTGPQHVSIAQRTMLHAVAVWFLIVAAKGKLCPGCFS